MRHFRFKGDPKRNGDGPATITAYGLEFDRDIPTPVADEAIARKLAANSHFQEMVRDSVSALEGATGPASDVTPTPVADEAPQAKPRARGAST